MTREVRPTSRPGIVLCPEGSELRVPADWCLVAPGDAALTRRIKKAGPSTPVEVFGLSECPETGDTLAVVKNEKDARTVAEHRAKIKREQEFMNTARATAEDLFKKAAEEDKEILHIVLKADVQGSVEAITSAFDNIQIDGTEIRLLHAGVGNINESDVQKVISNRGLICGFGVRVDAKARSLADKYDLKPEIFNVIYDVIDRVEFLLRSMLAPELVEVHRGHVEVKALFKISRIGTVAGCLVTEGKVGRNNMVRIQRDGEQLWEGRINTLKRFKDDVKEVTAGYECGIAFDGFNDILEGDTFEVYAMEEVPRV